ncbi:nucleotidyl transferase AbiEii/AbiGii toxin family protein [bacterium]|nr:nucleotidyl transferase AbiEii/AbiGii toxin family protein [bacterium]
MKYLHEHEDFKYFIIEAAKQVNLSEFIVEKDYWVTYLLKNLVKSEFANEFVFKGGTCLSKAYNLIERFSEDIDLLMIETEKTQSKTQKEKRLIALREYINSLNDLSYTTGNRSALYAAFRFSFPTISTNITDSVGKEILLEPGYRGGTVPEIQKKTITSYVEKLVDDKLEGYDTKQFEINVLSAERIFVEKVFAIKEIYDKDNGETLQKKTHHYYDIYKLLQTNEVQALLNDKTKLESIVADINEISNKYYNLEPVAWNELINHIALKPDEALFNKLKLGYKNDKALYYNQIEFEEIISALKNL